MKHDNSDYPALDVDHLRRFTGGDHGLEQEIFDLFLKNGERYLQSISQSNSADARRIAAHSLKGSARGIGAMQVEMAAERMEELAGAAEVERNRPFAELQRTFMQVREALAAHLLAMDEAD